MTRDLTSTSRNRTILYSTCFCAGLFIALTAPPPELLFAGLVVLLGTIIITAYLLAWRNGHTGFTLIPLKKGPFGTDGLGSRSTPKETIVISSCIITITGLGSGVLILIAVST